MRSRLRRLLGRPGPGESVSEPVDMPEDEVRTLMALDAADEGNVSLAWVIVNDQGVVCGSYWVAPGWTPEKLLGGVHSLAVRMARDVPAPRPHRRSVS